MFRLLLRIFMINQPARWVLFSLLLLAAACQPISAERATLPRAGDVAATPALDDATATLVARALADLAATQGIAPDQIELQAIEPVQWPDASLGCPEPDMVYAQMLTPGYRLVLTADGQEYIYHTGAGPDSPVVTCPE